MPKLRKAQEVSTNGVTTLLEAAKTTRSGVTTRVNYSVPATPQAFQELVMDLPSKDDGGAFARAIFGPKYTNRGESPLALVYRSWCSFVERAAWGTSLTKGRPLKSKAAIITMGKVKINLLEEFTPAKLVHAINHMRDERALKIEMMQATHDASFESEKVVDRNLKFNRWAAASRGLVVGYTNSQDIYVAPVAREANSGKLELLF